MEEKQKRSGLATFFSILYVLAAVCMLLGVCSYCYPAVGQELRKAAAGWEDSPVRQAFGTLTEGLEEGKPVKETVAASFEVLTGEAG